jgi:hypothetical protein
MRQHQRRGGVASDDDEIGTVGFDQLAHERAHPRDKLRLAASAVGKEGIVGDVDVARIGPRPDDLAKNREAAEPGIEDENGRNHGGCWYEKNGLRATSGQGATRAGRAGVLASCRTPADRRRCGLCAVNTVHLR